MSAPLEDVSLLQARLQSLERDLVQSQRRLDAKDEELRSLKAQHAKRQREWEDANAVLEGRCSIAESEVAKLQAAAAQAAANRSVAASASGRKPPPIPTEGGNTPRSTNSTPNAALSPPPPPPPAALPLRPLLPYTEDSPFFRREEAMFATKVTSLSTRLKKVVTRAKEFSQATSKFAETASVLAAELSSPWTEVEGGLDAILASAVQMQAAQAGGAPVPSAASAPSPSKPEHRTSRSSIIQTEELVSLSSAFGKLGAMLSTVCDIGTNLSVSVDAFLVSAMMDFRTKHIQSVLDKEQLLARAQEDFESAYVRRLNKKRERSMLSGLTGIVTDKQRKKAAAEEEEVRSAILVCSATRKQYELLRFDYVTLLNEVLLERRMELIEMVCASFLGFLTFFHEGHYVVDTLKREVDQINRHINLKRPLYQANGEAIREQRILVERSLELVVGGGSLGPPGSIEKVLNWRVRDAFPSSTTASGLMSPAAQDQQEQGQVLLPHTGTQRIPSPYAHAMVRGKLVPIEKEGYLRKQSSSLKKDWKKRWFILQNGQLFYVRDDSDINPVHVQAVLLCTVRVSQKPEDMCFDLISPTKRVYTLQAETEECMRQWMEVFQACSEALLNASGSMLTAHEQNMTSSELKDHIDSKTNAVQEIRKLNTTCADCGAKGQRRGTWVGMCEACVIQSR